MNNFSIANTANAAKLPQLEFNISVSMMQGEAIITIELEVSIIAVRVVILDSSIYNDTDQTLTTLS